MNEEAKTEEATVRPSKEVWEDLLMEVETASLDATKNIEKRNNAAGVRFRKSLRRVKALCSELIKATIVAGAETQVLRAEKRKTPKTEEAAS